MFATCPEFQRIAVLHRQLRSRMALLELRSKVVNAQHLSSGVRQSVRAFTLLLLLHQHLVRTLRIVGAQGVEVTTVLRTKPTPERVVCDFVPSFQRVTASSWKYFVA